jgi:hypothetical protein
VEIVRPKIIQELVIGQSRADTLTIHFEVSAPLPEACLNKTLIRDLANYVLDRPAVKRVSVDFVKHIWKSGQDYPFSSFAPFRSACAHFSSSFLR